MTPDSDEEWLLDLGPESTLEEIEAGARWWLDRVERDDLQKYNPPVHPNLLVGPLLDEIDRLRAARGNPQVNALRPPAGEEPPKIHNKGDTA